jgi:hypothetical protein
MSTGAKSENEKIRRFRDRAEECRAHAAEMKDQDARAGLIQVAESYGEWPTPSRRSFAKTLRPSRSVQGGLTGLAPRRAARNGVPRENRRGPATRRRAAPRFAQPGLRILRSRLTHDLGERRADRRVEAARIEA